VDQKRSDVTVTMPDLNRFFIIISTISILVSLGAHVYTWIHISSSHLKLGGTRVRIKNVDELTGKVTSHSTIDFDGTVDLSRSEV